MPAWRRGPSTSLPQEVESRISLKFIGGVSKKLGSADRDLLEVSCQIEIEFDDKFSSDADDLRHRVEQAYAACRQAGEDELGRNLKAGVQPGAGRAGTVGGDGPGDLIQVFAGLLARGLGGYQLPHPRQVMP